MLLVEDRALLDRFRRGDQSALERVYAVYARDVAVQLRRGFTFQSGGRSCRFHGTRSAADLEDRVHDVFVRAFSESARLAYDGLTPYKNYLYTVARNLVIDDFRKKERALVEYSVDVSEQPALDKDPELEAQDAQLNGLVDAFKRELPEREQMVWRMRFEEEKEHKDIAELTGLSASKIKTSESRIREGFFSFMKRHGYFSGFEQARHGWLRSLRGAFSRGGAE
jgi:RNA polymerase sigma factor (sigma-70 family)